MSTPPYEELLEKAQTLSPQQCLLLIERLIHRMRTAEKGSNTAPSWEDYAGSAPYPLCGGDAQEWVCRERQDSDESREPR